MARRSRLALAGHPHLVVQTGRVGVPAFADDLDRRCYLDALRIASRDCAVAVHAYAVTDREAWLVVTPSDAEALGRMMQRLGRRYVAHHHARHGTQGALWAGRFQSAALAAETHLLAAIRLVEQAPVRAGLAATARAWPWSSAPQHVGDAPGGLITEHPLQWRLGNTPFEREARHARELEAPLAPTQLAEFGAALRGGWPIGPAPFAALVAAGTGRTTRPRPRGRPPSQRRRPRPDDSVPK